MGVGMKYSIDIDDKVSEAIYRMGLFDLSVAGANSSLNCFIRHIDLQCSAKAVQACIDISPNSPDREYSSGFVAGIKAFHDFIIRSFDEGEANRNEKPAQ
jgi:hypothetical protein